jgi:hypothetical protein
VQAKATFNFSATTIGSVAAYANDRGAKQLAGASLKELQGGGTWEFVYFLVVAVLVFSCFFFTTVFVYYVFHREIPVSIVGLKCSIK